MAKSFKDFLMQDIDNVFVNEDEFGETVTINDKEMVIVRDSDSLNQFDTSKQLATYDVLFHVATSYFEHIPQPEKMMKFEGEVYRIKRVDNNLGMLTIGLSRKDS